MMKTNEKGPAMEKHVTSRLAHLLLFVCAALAACVNPSGRPGQPDPGQPDDTTTDDSVRGQDGLPDDGEGAGFACRVPGPGCPCDEAEDPPVECHSESAIEDEHGRLRCLVGRRACEDGVWGACVFSSEYEIPAPGQRAFGDPPASCANCDPSCYEIGDDFSVDPGSLAANGVGIIWDGALGGIVISGSGGSVSFPYAYIGLESTSELAKIDTTTGAQVGRYIVGVAGSGASSDPSRTAVDTVGDVYVAQRARAQPNWHGYDGSGDWASVAKIAGDLARCVDSSGNAVIETSTDDIAMAAGTDECILWDAAVNSAPGGHLRGLVVDRGDVSAPNGYPWVAGEQNPDGGSEPGIIFQLDPDDGTVLQSLTLPIHVYGAVVDGGTPQRIWLTSRRSGRLAAVVLDTVPYIEGPFSPSVPGVTGTPMDDAYGIGIDSAGRIWRGSWTPGPIDYVTGYNPATGAWCYVAPGYATSGLSVRVNSDGSNTVFASVRGASPGRIVWFDPDVACVAANVNATYCDTYPDSVLLTRFQRDGGCSGTVNEVRSLDIHPGPTSTRLAPAGHDDSHGMGIGTDGRVWMQARATDNIWVYDPVTDTGVTYPSSGTFGEPYSYSDFTGYSRNTFSLAGTSEFMREYGVDSPACPPASTPVWGDLSWTAITVNSYIEFFAQVATDPAQLDAASRIPLGAAPADASPIYVQDLIPLNLQYAPYIRIIASLKSNDGVTSPILISMGLDWSCTESE